MKSGGDTARTSSACAIAVLAVVLGGCRRSPPPQPLPSPQGEEAVQTTAPAQAVAAPQELPASYSGLLPCADCEGIRYQLDLRPDQVYFSRMTYVGKPEPNTFDEVGRWSLSDEAVLTLQHGGGSPEQWAMLDVGSLHKLDAQGHPIASQHNFTLTRQPQYEPLEPSLELRGMYRRVAQGGVFEECQTGLALTLAPQSNRAALDTAFVKARGTNDEPVLATIQGRIARGRTSDLLVVDGFKSIAPNESCSPIGVTHELEGTRWVLVRLNEESITLDDSQREPYIVLEPTERRVSGHGGCNRIVGRYEETGQTLHFTELAMTRMACPHLPLEDAFQKSLTAASQWSIEANQLKFLDASGTIVARFEARNLM